MISINTKKVTFGSALALAALFVLTATIAQAGAPVLYNGTIIIQAFGEDNTAGLAYPQNEFVYLGQPFGITCNPNAGALCNVNTKTTTQKLMICESRKGPSTPN